MIDDTQTVLERVQRTDEGRSVIESSERDRAIVFHLGEDEDVLTGDDPEAQQFTITIDSESDECQIASGDDSTSTAQQTEIRTTTETYEALLGGALFSERYLDGEITVRGLRTGMFLFAQLIRINREMYIDRLDRGEAMANAN